MTVNEAVKMLTTDGYDIDKDLLELCYLIEEYNFEKEKKIDNVSFEKEIDVKLAKLGMNKSTKSAYSKFISLTAEEKVLVVLYPGEAVVINSCKEKACEYTIEKFGYKWYG